MGLGVKDSADGFAWAKTPDRPAIAEHDPDGLPAGYRRSCRRRAGHTREPKAYWRTAADPDIFWLQRASTRVTPPGC